MAKASPQTETAIENIESVPLQLTHLPALYKKLNEASSHFPLPIAIESTDGGKTGKGYDTTGYRYQFLVNAMNEVFGSNHWMCETALVEKNVTSGRGRDRTNVCLQVTVKIGNWLPGENKDGSQNFFEILDQKSHFGHGSSSDIGEAYKGAQTNGLKKVLALFGLGQEAFTGELAAQQGIKVEYDDQDFEDDNESAPSGRGSAPKSTPPPSDNVCHITGMLLSNKQLEYCKENGYKPTVFNVIKQYMDEGRVDELKL